jgi:uncharacterized protein (DUF2141 family)
MLLVAGALLLTGNDAAADTDAVTAHGPEASLLVSFEGLRSAKGLMRVCLTRNPHFFPDCDKDPAAFKASVAAGPDAHLRIPDVPGGDYALSVLHDENSNARADMLLGIPREGVGFSENPRLLFSAPKFAAARFHIGSLDVTKQVRIRYFL